MLTLLGGLFTPGYSHVSQFISELGASQAAHEYPVRLIGFLPAGVTLLAFCWFAHRALPKASLTSAALIALAGLLTLSPTSSLVGLSQRAVEVAVLGWVVACGWYIDARSRVAA